MNYTEGCMAGRILHVVPFFSAVLGFWIALGEKYSNFIGQHDFTVKTAKAFYQGQINEF